MYLLSSPAIADLLREGYLLCRSALTFQGAWRIGVFAHQGRGLTVPPLLDGFVDPLPSGPLIGGWNAGFATGFTTAWWGGPGAWTAVGADGEAIAWLDGGALHTPEGSLARPRAARLYVAPGWERRQVSVIAGYTEVVIAVEEDAAPAVDPAYDRDHLSADTAWMEQLGQSLAAAIGGTFEVVIEAR